METIDLVILFIVLVGVGIILLIFYNYQSEDHSTDTEEVIKTQSERANPNHSAFRSEIETKKVKANTELVLALMENLVARAKLIAAQAVLRQMPMQMDLEWSLKLAEHTTNLLSQQNNQIAITGANEQKIRLAVFETILLTLTTGDLGRAITEAQKMKLITPLEMEKKRLEFELDFNARKNLDDWKQDRTQKFLEE